MDFTSGLVIGFTVAHCMWFAIMMYVRSKQQKYDR